MRWRAWPHRDVTKWHVWFAWHPVRAQRHLQPDVWVWLEPVERQIAFGMSSGHAYPTYRVPRKE